MKLLQLIMAAPLSLAAIPQTAHAAPNDRPTQSVTDNTRADSLGIFANNAAGISMCWTRLASGTARFYMPTDVRGFDANARTAPLEANTCARMRVRGGLIGVVALREGSLVNLGQRNGSEQPVAYNVCNNWLELLQRPTVPQEATTLPASIITVNTTPTHSTQIVENVVTIRRITRYVYEDVVEGGEPPEVTVNVPPPVYRYVTVPQPVVAQPPRCICYWPPNDPSVTQLYRFPYPDRAGQWWCVPLYMAQTNTPPPGFVR